MLAEKFCLVLETMLERKGDGIRVQSTSPHVPVVLTAKVAQPATPKPTA